MNHIEIKDILPDPNKNVYEEVKRQHPHTILLKYARAIEEKYDQKLRGNVTSSSDIDSEKLIIYSFYLIAEIGRGYSYRLLDIESIDKGKIYPLNISLIGQISSGQLVVNDPEELEVALIKIFENPFTQQLILNMLAQIDIYNASKEEL